MCIYMSAQPDTFHEQLIGEEKAIFADFQQPHIKDALHGEKKVERRRLAVSVDLAAKLWALLIDSNYNSLKATIKLKTGTSKAASATKCH